MTASPPSPSGVAMAAMVSSCMVAIYKLKGQAACAENLALNLWPATFNLNMPAITDLIFRIAAL
jgi:hypothetical protein